MKPGTISATAPLPHQRPSRSRQHVTSYDTSGFATDIRTKGGLLVANLGTLDPVMAGITLTQKEIGDLQAFLGSL